MRLKQKSTFNSQQQTTLQQHYLLNDPVDDQRILQDVLADARVEHDPCDTQDWDSEYWSCVMLMSWTIYSKIAKTQFSIHFLFQDKFILA